MPIAAQVAAYVVASDPPPRPSPERPGHAAVMAPRLHSLHALPEERDERERASTRFLLDLLRRYLQSPDPDRYITRRAVEHLDGLTDASPEQPAEPTWTHVGHYIARDTD